MKPRRNVELKAVDPDPAASLAVCARIGAEDLGVLRQRDTYFHTRSGRLKLREEEPGGATLISYLRPDRAEARESAYRLIRVLDPEAMLDALSETVGRRGAVLKRRHLFMWENVRIHLDHVGGLGDFIEFEAVAPVDSDLVREHALVGRLCAEFGVTQDRVCDRGYADMLGLG